MSPHEVKALDKNILCNHGHLLYTNNFSSDVLPTMLTRPVFFIIAGTIIMSIIIYHHPFYRHDHNRDYFYSISNRSIVVVIFFVIHVFLLL